MEKMKKIMGRPSGEEARRIAEEVNRARPLLKKLLGIGRVKENIAVHERRKARWEMEQLFGANPEQVKHWQNMTVEGAKRLIERVWEEVRRYREAPPDMRKEEILDFFRERGRKLISDLDYAIEGIDQGKYGPYPKIGPWEGKKLEVEEIRKVQDKIREIMENLKE